MAETVEKKTVFTLESKIEGYVANLLAAQQATKASTDAIANEFGKVGSGINTLIGITGRLSGVLAGGVAFKAVVTETVAWDLSAAKLSKTLGGTIENASILKVALDHLGVDQDLVSTASLRMAKTLNTNSEAFKNLGVDVAEMQKSGKSNLDIMMSTIQAIGQYSAGLDRNEAAMTIFGRSWGELQSLMKLTPAEFDRARKKAEELHLIVGPEGVKKAKEYKEGLNDLKLVQTSIAHTAGTEVVGALVEMGAMMQGPATTAAHILASAVHEVHLGFKDIIADKGDFDKQLTRAVNNQAVSAMTLLMAYQAVRRGDFSVLPLIFKTGIDAGHAVNQSLSDVDPQMSRIDYDKANKGSGKHWQPPSGEGADSQPAPDPYIAQYNSLQDDRLKGAITGNAALSETEKKLAEVGLKYQELIRLYPNHRAELERNLALDQTQIRNLADQKKALEDLAEIKQINAEMDLDEIENGLKKSDAWLNFMGKMSDSQQAHFDQSAMLSEWAARKSQLDREAQQAGEKFMNGGLLGDGGVNQNPALERLNHERDAAIQNWAMMTDSFEEHQRRMALINQSYSIQRKKIDQDEASAKRQLAANAFGNMASIADSFYQLSGRKSKEAMRAYQVTKSGETAITTYDTAIKAYNSLASIPYVGPALGAAAAAAATMYGMAQLQGIWSVSDSGASSISGAGASGSSGNYTSSPVVTQPAAALPQTREQGSVTLVFQGNVMDQRYVEETVIPLINDAGTRDVRVNYIN